MESPSNGQKVEPSSAVVYELPGEPAIVIDGVPEIPSTESTRSVSDAAHDAESRGNTDFGEWLEGREVRKLFGEQNYFGTVTEYDKEAGWYRVVYEDGDFEDLDWTELEQVLLPLDIMVPLKTVALKTLRKSKKFLRKPRNVIAGSQTQKAKTKGSRGRKATSAIEGASKIDFKVGEDASMVDSKVLEDASMVDSKVAEAALMTDSKAPEYALMTDYKAIEDASMMKSDGL